jgi:hypothetical protein
MLNQALTSELGVELFLKAFAFTTAFDARMKGPLYCVDD